MHRLSNPKSKQAATVKKRKAAPTKPNNKRKLHHAAKPRSTTMGPITLVSAPTRAPVMSLRRRAFSAVAGEGSDPAFAAKPKEKQEKSQTEQEQDDILQQIDAVVKAYPVVLFMKGTPSEPRCGFSRRVVQILHEFDLTYEACNVLESDELREAVKTYSNWPTLPQLFVGGEFVGGCDIITQMYQAGELAEILPKKNAAAAAVSEAAKDQAV